MLASTAVKGKKGGESALYDEREGLDILRKDQGEEGGLSSAEGEDTRRGRPEKKKKKSI